MAKMLIVIGTNDVGKLKKFRRTNPEQWPGGMLWVNESGHIWLSHPRRRIAKLPLPLRGRDFVEWLKAEGIHIDKIYSSPESTFKSEVELLKRAEEDALVAALVKRFQV